MSENRNADLDKIQASAEHTLQAFCATANVIPDGKYLAALRKIFDDIRTDADETRAIFARWLPARRDEKEQA